MELESQVSHLFFSGSSGRRFSSWLCMKTHGGGGSLKNADATALLSQTWIQSVWVGPEDTGVFKTLPSSQVFVFFYYFLPR